MRSLFNNCKKLIHLDLSYFDTSKVTTMAKMFYHCENIKFLDLSHFNTLKVENIYEMFYHCESLIYLNLDSFQFDNLKNTTKAFNGISSIVKYCYKGSSSKDFILENKASDCSDDCFKKNIKIDITNNKCVDSCKNNEYEYNNICYHECPRGTYELFCEEKECNNDIKICFDINPEGYYFNESINKFKKCFDTCKYCYGEGNEITNNCTECKSNYIFLNETEYKTNCFQKCQDYYYFNKDNKYII